ncbi:thiamine pyrophosphokinase [Aspergillus crustosus]
MEWDPTQFFREDIPTTPLFALVVTNQPLNEKALSVLRRHARIIVCADGGANRFFEWAKSRGEESTDIPNTIIGDLDSIRPEVRSHYANLGVTIIEDDDQYSTDLTKSLRYLREHEKEIALSSSLALSSTQQDSKPALENQEHHEPLSTLILGGLGGRVDQAFSQIHHLYLMNQENSNHASEKGENGRTAGTMYLISEESITFILQPGKNTIHVPRTNIPSTTSPSSQTPTQPQPQLQLQKQDQNQNQTHPYLLEENIGIIPLTGTDYLTTSGFEWDVENWKTEIGGLLSTSNHIRAETVTVETRGPVLFTVELAVGLKRGVH